MMMMMMFASRHGRERSSQSVDGENWKRERERKKSSKNEISCTSRNCWKISKNFSISFTSSYTIFWISFFISICRLQVINIISPFSLTHRREIIKFRNQYSTKERQRRSQVKYVSDWSRICAAAPWHPRALKNSNCERVLWPTFYHFHVDAAIFFLVGIILFSRPLRSRELCAFHVKSMKIDDAKVHTIKMRRARRISRFLTQPSAS